MVSALMGYDFRVRFVPLAHATLLIAPLIGVFAYLALPRPSFRWDTALGIIPLTIFYAVMILANVGMP
jgi:hypothetical protein